MRFTVFERVSGWLQEGNGEVHTMNALVAGTVAGAAESGTCLTPLQNIQIKMTQDADPTRQTRMYRCAYHRDLDYSGRVARDRPATKVLAISVR